MLFRTGALLVFVSLGACASHPMSAPDASPDAAADACVPGAPPSAACPLCVPGATDCRDDGLGTRRCNPDGLSYTDVARCDAASGQLCAHAACVDPCADAAANHSYQGCEFYAAGLIDSSLAADFDDVSIDDFPFAVALTNPWPVAVTVTLDGGGLGGTISQIVPPHGANVISLPWVRALCQGGDAELSSSAVALDGAVHVRASAPISAYQFNPRGFTLGVSSDTCTGRECWAYTNDASLLLPVAALGTQYVAVSRPTVRVKSAGSVRWRLSSGFVAVVGTGPGATDVTVTLNGSTAAGIGLAAAARGTVIHQRLGPGDVLQLLSTNDLACASPEPDMVYGDVFCTPVPDEDLTGTLIEASAPVAVFSGHNSALVPYNRYAGDHLEEQLVPVESLGTHYLVARTPPAYAEPNLVRVVATRPNTTVTFSPPGLHAPAVLAAAGDNVEFEIRQGVEVTADSPVEVAEFLVGGNYDQSVGDRVGDPDLVLAVPVDQYLNAYDFVAEDGFGTSTAIAVVPHGEALMLDGVRVAVVASDTVGGYDVLDVPVYQGAHHLAAVHPGIRFGLTVSGLALYTSYTYPGGLSLAPISPPL